MPFNVDNLALYLIDALRDSNPPKIPNQPAQAATQQQPVANQAPMPALPTLGQAAGQGGGGIGQTLGNMGKSFLGTVANTLPTALVNAALFGDNPQSRAMTYSSMVDQLKEKRRKEEERRNNMKGDLATFGWSMAQYGKQLGIPKEDVFASIIGGNKTGNQGFDNQIEQMQELMKPMIQRGEINAGDLYDSFIEKQSAYEKLLEEKGVLSEKAFGQQVDLAKAKQKPTQEPAIMQSYRNDVENFGFTGSFADWKKSQQKPDKPEKPDKPAGHWVQKEDGTYVYQTTEDKPIKGRLPVSTTEKDNLQITTKDGVKYIIKRKNWMQLQKDKKTELELAILGSDRDEDLTDEQVMVRTLSPYLNSYGEKVGGSEKNKQLSEKYVVGGKYQGKTIVNIGRDDNGIITQLKLQDNSIIKVK